MKIFLICLILLRFLSCISTPSKGETIPDYIDDVENVKNYA